MFSANSFSNGKWCRITLGCAILVFLLLLISKCECYQAEDNDVADNVGAHVKDYELTRRKVLRDINEFWWYIQSNLESFSKINKHTLKALLGKVLVEGQHRYRAIVSAVDDISENDGHKKWREQESKDLSSIVQKRLLSLQNPKNCSSARKLLCKLDRPCGFGCQFHNVVVCLIFAYGTERTLVLDGRHWSYNDDTENGFEEVFMPLTTTCAFEDLDFSNIAIEKWPGTKDANTIEFPKSVKSNRLIVNYTAIPDDLADRIIRLHGSPLLWWVSQFVKFVWQPTARTRIMLDEIEKLIKNKKAPLVGVHIRRNDKIIEKEVEFYDLEEYMKPVKEFFQQIEANHNHKLSVNKYSRQYSKQVYLASDDPNVFVECRKRFPEYEFIGDETRAASATLSSRYSLNSLNDVIVDIHMLSLSDYIVCSLSSNVCTLAHELQQNRFVDASMKIKSLDTIWTMNPDTAWVRLQRIILNHSSTEREELNMNVGDYIRMKVNLQNGFNTGTLLKSKKSGFYPLYKTVETFRTAVLPTYPNARNFKMANMSRASSKRERISNVQGKAGD